MTGLPPTPAVTGLPPTPPITASSVTGLPLLLPPPLTPPITASAPDSCLRRLLHCQTERFDLILGGARGGGGNVVLAYPSPLSLLATAAPADTDQHSAAHPLAHDVNHPQVMRIEEERPAGAHIATRSVPPSHTHTRTTLPTVTGALYV